MRRAAQADAAPARRPPRWRTPGARGTISVSGPGQKACIRRRAAARHVGGEDAAPAPRRPRARSAGGRPAGPWPRRCAPPPRRRRRGRPGRRPSRSGKATSSPAASARPRRCTAGGSGRGSSGIAPVGVLRRRAGRAAQPPAAPRPRRGGVGRGHRQVPHLAPAPRLGLAVQVQVHAGQRQHAGPVGRARLSRRRANHRSPSRLSITAAECRRGGTSGSAGQRAHLQVELRHVAGVDAVVARVVRPRRHLVGHQRAVVAARRTRRTARPRSPASSARRAASATACAAAAAAMPGAGTCVTARMPSRCRFCCTGRCTTCPSAPRATITLISRRSGRRCSSTQGTPPQRGPGRGQVGARGHAAPGPCRRSPAARSSGCRAAAPRAGAASVGRRLDQRACGAQGTPPRTKSAFSSARCWQTCHRLRRGGDTGSEWPARRSAARGHVFEFGGDGDAAAAPAAPARRGRVGRRAGAGRPRRRPGWPASGSSTATR